MPDPTQNCPNPDAPDFLRCLSAWETKDALTYNVPFVVVYRCVALDGTVDEAALAKAVKKYRHKRKPQKQPSTELR